MNKDEVIQLWLNAEEENRKHTQEGEEKCIELKDKFSDSEFKLTSNANSTEMSDIQNALSALGYNQKDIVIVTKDLDKNISVNEGIKKALKLLSN